MSSLSLHVQVSNNFIMNISKSGVSVQKQVTDVCQWNIGFQNLNETLNSEISIKIMKFYYQLLKVTVNFGLYFCQQYKNALSDQLGTENSTSH